jgi:hypothetical protein
MTDAKKSTNKVRKPSFWQRRRNPSSETALLSSSVETAKTAVLPWYRSTLLKFAAVLLAALTILPIKANGQFCLDVAAILAALQKMQSLMTTYIAGPLKTVNQYEQTTAKYEQQVMYPLAAINQVKNSVMQFENQFSQVSNLFHVNVASATLPQSGGLETLLFSRNATNVGSVSGQYQSVYGVVMAQNTASPSVRTVTDMTDAQAQDAMKRAIATIHDRMPVIVERKDYSRWLDTDEKTAPPTDLLHPYAANQVRAWPVSDRVGNIRNNDASLLDPVDTSNEPAQGQLF